MQKWLSGAFILTFGALIVTHQQGRSLTAQDKATADEKAADYHLRAVPEPADPDPTQQTPAERLQTLRKRITEAKTALEKDDLVGFFKSSMDPFWIARGVAGFKGDSVRTFLQERILSDAKQKKHLVEVFGKVLQDSLEAEPRWLLEGRVASFMTSNSSHSAEFWVYYDGKWRISPET